MKTFMWLLTDFILLLKPVDLHVIVEQENDKNENSRDNNMCFVGKSENGKIEWENKCSFFFTLFI